MAGMMYQMNSPCGSQDARYFGLLIINNLVPCGYSSVCLLSNSLYICAYADRWGWSLDWQSRFRLIVSCCSNLSHSLSWDPASTFNSPARKWFLKILIDLSVFLALWLLGVTNWYFISMVVLEFLNSVDALLSMIWKPGFIPRLSKYAVNSTK